MTYQEALEMLGQERKYPRVLVFSQYPAMNEAVELAIRALEMRIPKKPNILRHHFVPGTMRYDHTSAVCPHCNSVFKYDDKHQPICCEFCGQVLDIGE